MRTSILLQTVCYDLIMIFCNNDIFLTVKLWSLLYVSSSMFCLIHCVVVAEGRLHRCFCVFSDLRDDFCSIIFKHLPALHGLKCDLCHDTDSAHSPGDLHGGSSQISFSAPWQPQIPGKGTLFPFLKSLLEPSQPMTIQSGKGQTTHSSQLLSVGNKMGVWGWVSDNILQLLCKNLSNLSNFWAWQQMVIDKATMNCNLTCLSAVYF